MIPESGPAVLLSFAIVEEAMVVLLALDVVAGLPASSCYRNWFRPCLDADGTIVGIFSCFCECVFKCLFREKEGD